MNVFETLRARYVHSEVRTRTRYGEAVQEIEENLRVGRIIFDAAGAVVALILLVVFWPIREVPTGHRGVITIGGAIQGVEEEGYHLVFPWESLSLFSIRAELAVVEGAEG